MDDETKDKVLNYLVESHKTTEKTQDSLLENQNKQLNKIINYLLVVAFASEATKVSLQIFNTLNSTRDTIEQIAPSIPNRDPRDNGGSVQ